MRNHNKSLFWYGVRAKLMKVIGVILMVAGFWFYGISYWITLGFFIIGVIIFAKGCSKRFDYKRQSGYIVHGGDR